MKSTVTVSTSTFDTFIPIPANLIATSNDSATVKDTLWGYAVGGGVDVAIDPRWVLRAEYLYLGFEKKDHGAVVIPGVSSLENGMNIQTVRAALSYRFAP
jgi:opacity protein-like surface antigen